MQSPVNAGTVEWSGENPGIYLKESTDGAWTALAVFFKVVTSPLGRGSGAILLAAPSSAATSAQLPNVCVSDNEPLMRWLVDKFVSRFATFRNAPGLAAMAYHASTGSGTAGDGVTFHEEWIQSKDLRLNLRWEQLSHPFAVDVPPAMSATGQHQMYSVFVEAQRGVISVNDRRLGGMSIQRDFLGRRMSTSFLAFSETWIVPHE